MAGFSQAARCMETQDNLKELRREREARRTQKSRLEERIRYQNGEVPGDNQVEF